MSAPTRRGLLGGAAVLTAASGAVVVASPTLPHPDTVLLYLDATLTRAIVDENSAWSALDDPTDDDPGCVHARALSDVVARL